LTDQLQWARTPPSASWRFESGRDRPRRDRSPRRRSQTPPPRRRGGDYSPRKDDRRDRDYDRRDRSRSRTPDDRDRSPRRDRDHEMKDVRDRDDRENGANGDERLKSMPQVLTKDITMSDLPDDSPPGAHDELDTAE